MRAGLLESHRLLHVKRDSPDAEPPSLQICSWLSAGGDQRGVSLCRRRSCVRFAYSAWWTRRSPRLLTPLTRALARSLTHVPLILGTRYRSEPPIYMCCRLAQVGLEGVDWPAAGHLSGDCGAWPCARWIRWHLLCLSEPFLPAHTPQECANTRLPTDASLSNVERPAEAERCRSLLRRFCALPLPKMSTGRRAFVWSRSACVRSTFFD